MIRASEMPLLRAWLPTIALLAPLTLAVAAPARADAPASPAARHQGVAFAAPKGARARIVEPDGRIVTSDGVSDLVAPASIASRQAQNAIARLISAEVVNRGEVQTLPDAAPSDPDEAGKTQPRREANRGLKFGNVTPGI